jgi:hypothetical protein
MRLLLFLGDLLDLLIGFWYSSCASLGLGFKLQTLCFLLSMDSSRGEIEKPNDQDLDLICDESLTCRDLNLNLGHFDRFTFILLFVWRVAFACLVVCR